MLLSILWHGTTVIVFWTCVVVRPLANVVHICHLVELVALVFVALGVLVFGLFWVVAYKDERDELGAQEEAAALESDSSSSEDDRDGSDSEARP